ncbi:MAG: S-adenosyl-l-methionine hydroxide adenosyltransferase family protein [Bdellovibrionaceae bacterium]|nr:S-adenosyl-l-methionine hydroxide adenosyltransferase family protein [Pseudobdellovibrionaceae bacterium]
MRKFAISALALWALVFGTACSHLPETAGRPTRQALVLMTDFGLKDGAVSEMRGVAYQVAPDLLISDITHEVPPFDIWQAAYRMKQTAPYWADGTVFVTVVDPGVGSERKSIVAKSKSGKYYVGPDNGHLTLISEMDPFAEVRVIDESKSRLKGSEESYTFHGRDLYVYVGAQLAAGTTKFEDVGQPLGRDIVRLDYQKTAFEGGVLKGQVPILDVNYGNVWTNISKKEFLTRFPNPQKLKVRILNKKKVVYQGTLPYVTTFAAVPKGQPLLYINSLLDLSVALNQGSFAAQHKIGSGLGWTIEVQNP